MSISGAINSARTGLQINGLRAGVVATNVANAATPGFVRRSVSLSETLLNGETTGVRSDGIAQADNPRLAEQRRSVSSDLTQANLLSSAWATLSAKLGDALDSSGLFAAYADFGTALSNAALTPESDAALTQAVAAADQVTSVFSDLSATVSRMRQESDREIADGVNVINSALEKVEALNARLAGIDRTSGEAAAVRDERQRTLDTIAEYLPIQTVERDYGGLDVLTREGVFLLAGSARQISFTPSSAVGPGQTLAGGQLSGLAVGDTDITPGATTYGAVSSGVFSGLFRLRDTDLTGFGAQLDALAGDLVSRLSASTVDPTTPAGAPGLLVDTGTPGAPGLAGRLAINAAIDPNQGGAVWRLRDGIAAVSPGPPGSAVILRNLSDAFTAIAPVAMTGVSGALSSIDAVATFSSLTGQTRLSHEAVAASAQTRRTLLAETQAEQTGVDIDTQMQDLLLIEQAYAANARVIEIASNLLNRLMEI